LIYRCLEILVRLFFGWVRLLASTFFYLPAGVLPPYVTVYKIPLLRSRTPLFSWYPLALVVCYLIHRYSEPYLKEETAPRLVW
jgi:hypothetical protein